jgi:hypothetical protein
MEREAVGIRVERKRLAESSPLGTTQETAGRAPFLASVKSLVEATTLPSWLSWRTSLNSGSGFQIEGVVTACAIGLHDIEPVSQSGSVPRWM